PTKSSTVPSMNGGALSSIPISASRPFSVPLESAAAPLIHKGNRDECQEGDDGDEAKHSQCVVSHGPRVKEDHLNVEHDEGHGHQVVLDGHAATARGSRCGLQA